MNGYVKSSIIFASRKAQICPIVRPWAEIYQTFKAPILLDSAHETTHANNPVFTDRCFILSHRTKHAVVSGSDLSQGPSTQASSSQKQSGFRDQRVCLQMQKSVEVGGLDVASVVSVTQLPCPLHRLTGLIGAR